MWAEDRASRSLGMSLDAVSPGAATVSMTLTDDMVNGHAIGHGGLTFTLADSALAFACNSYNRGTVAARAEIRFRRPTHLGTGWSPPRPSASAPAATGCTTCWSRSATRSWRSSPGAARRSAGPSSPRTDPERWLSDVPGHPEGGWLTARGS